MSKGAKRLGNKTNLTLSENTSVQVKSECVKLWRHIGNWRV